ncbi:MAG: PAS domain S-box protein [Nitrospirae bacterium]|nr:PAS domain S-box protein [Nitrospirota bacterium]
MQGVNQALREQVAQLHETERLYTSLMDTIPDIVYKVDLDGNFTFINGAVRMIGYEPEELIGRHFSTIIEPEEIEYVSRLAVLPRYMGKALGEHHSPKLFDERRTLHRSTHGLEVHIIRKCVANGSKETASKTHETIIGEVNSSGVYTLDYNRDHKEFIGTLGIIKPIEQGGSSGVIRDITVRKQEVDSLLRLKKIMEDITQGISDSMSLMTDDFRILWANKAAEEHMGYRLDELVGRHCYEVTHHIDTPCDSPSHPCPLREVMATGKSTTMLHTHLDKQGNKRYVEVTVYRITEEDASNITRYIYVSKDVTEKKEMEESLFELNRMLEGRVQQETMLKLEKEQLLIQQSKMASMGEMITSIIHQWKQPLNAISLTIMEISEANTFGDLNKDYLDTLQDNILQQIQFMSKTMDDFKNFLLPSKEKISFDIIKATEDIITMFSPLFKKNNILINLKSPKDNTLEVSGYPNEFKQVILNLINNSRDAIVSRVDETRSGGHIDINIFNEGGKIIVSICDDGGGIEPEIMDRIFEPYFTTKPSDKGTGIGLYISKTIIEDNMGWRLTAGNVEGATEFRIEI